MIILALAFTWASALDDLTHHREHNDLAGVSQVIEILQRKIR